MNVYRLIGDAVATLEARDLAERLVAWHDAMVKHIRAVTLRGAPCGDGCPHEQARSLWREALEIFGDEAARLTFLRTHGAVPAAVIEGAALEARV